eukprot:TRINITY_DN5985_c0_g3_i2.p1 TRINITY_DN5985_c0_g3~~TRINITY_DN5985_c0_g3_i2.p1  ORF type:complete len:201 (-),score=64.11 TRINITY_DN5985_c0_g3_i2:154-756(-)
MDTTSSYGKMAMYKNVNKFEVINQQTVYAASGEVSDFQELTRFLREVERRSLNAADGYTHNAHDYANLLARKQYQMRNKGDPFLVQSVIGGIVDGKPYLAVIDPFGTPLQKTAVLTGYARYLCPPIVQNYWDETADEEKARRVVEECFKVLFYRDAKAVDRIQIAIVTERGVTIDEPIKLKTKWDHEAFLTRANEKLHTQ